MTADTIACLKITLDDVKPAVLRRVEVPLGIRLDRLHLTIQAAMGGTSRANSQRSVFSMGYDHRGPVPVA
jgi:hypothetical protein